MATYEVTLDRKSYTWDGKGWYQTADFIAPPMAVVHKLNQLLGDPIAEEDSKITGPDELADRARNAMAASQHVRAESLIRRAYTLSPTDGRASTYSSILRRLGRPDEALGVADKHRGTQFAPLLTSRAAALCDLDRWEEADRQIRQVFGILRNARMSEKTEAFHVLDRIKAAQP